LTLYKTPAVLTCFQVFLHQGYVSVIKRVTLLKE
jgi:hypothetical protein